ncbi:hypothetical protein [Sedimenticola hydrogenitrophicus]|uniref:hypothetical protein n=1 Tax=Sedimenticola hydrogenitrophicus TaxID=2967975 RepID=UPI0023AF0E85|nr:hypothetical protein [Sedimenticola hydrogenitrophicus]
MTNIELFNEYTARILGRLYASFPEKITLDPRQISGHDQVDDFGRLEKPAEHCLATLQWLAEAGLIRTDGCDRHYCRACVLTPKGLHLLNAVPDSLQGKTPLGARLAALIGEGAIDLAKEAVKTAITGLAAGS